MATPRLSARYSTRAITRPNAKRALARIELELHALAHRAPTRTTETERALAYRSVVDALTQIWGLYREE
jgi:hypothetical protein